jgi:hypothetical protein
LLHHRLLPQIFCRTTPSHCKFATPRALSHFSQHARAPQLSRIIFPPLTRCPILQPSAVVARDRDAMDGLARARSSSPMAPTIDSTAPAASATSFTGQPNPTSSPLHRQIFVPPRPTGASPKLSQGVTGKAPAKGGSRLPPSPLHRSGLPLLPRQPLAGGRRSRRPSRGHPRMGRCHLLHSFCHRHHRSPRIIHHRSCPHTTCSTKCRKGIALALLTNELHM